MPVPRVEGVRKTAPARPQAIQRDVREHLLAIKGAHRAVHLPHHATVIWSTLMDDGSTQLSTMPRVQGVLYGFHPASR